MPGIETGWLDYALFATDEWRVTPRLTLNYGLRWDVDDRPQEFYERYYEAFQPRLGLAYSFFSDRLVRRAAGGICQGVTDAECHVAVRENHWARLPRPAS